MNSDIFSRIFSFSFLLLGLWILCNFLSRSGKTYQAQFKGLAAGFPYCMANLWITVLFASMIPVFNGKHSMILIFFFGISSIVLIVSNIYGITEIQSAFKCGAASLVIPVQQIPVQLAPVFYFFYVFMPATPGKNSIFLIIPGTVLIIAGGFKLGKKHEAVN